MKHLQKKKSNQHYTPSAIQKKMKFIAGLIYVSLWGRAQKKKNSDETLVYWKCSV